MGERINLANEHPQVTEQLKEAALAWRSEIEKNWEIMQKTPTEPVSFTK
jgi:hypothetical protein